MAYKVILTPTDHRLVLLNRENDPLVEAPWSREETDDNGLVIAALVRVAGDLLVAEYDAQHSVLNDAVRAKNQAVAFAEWFRAMTGMPPPSCLGEVPAEKASIYVCSKCGENKLPGQACLACELAAEAAAEGNKPLGQ